MITCCEIAITLAVTNLLSLAIFAGYTVHLKERTLKLEKKNGHERADIEKMKKELAELKWGGGLNPTNSESISKN